MSDTKGTINIDKVKKGITRILNNSQDTPYIDHFSIYNDNVQVYIQGRIDFTTLNEIKEEMQDKNMKVSPANQDTIVISFDVNGCKYREYELPKYDLKPLEYYQDKMINILDYKLEEVFKNNCYHYLYTYKDKKIKEYASQNWENPIKEFYCLAKPDKPRTSSAQPPFIVCKAFIYYINYNIYQEQSSIAIKLEIIDKKLYKRYNKYLPNWSISTFRSVFPIKYGDMCTAMFNITENIKFIERNLGQSIMVFDTLEEAQDMCDKVNEYYNVYRLKNSWYD